MKLLACYALTHDRPLRISALSSLVRCPGFLVSRTADDHGGAAAQNGSAVGRVIQLAHEGWVFDEAIRQTTTEAATQWPLANMDVVTQWAASYCSDPRNGAGSEYGEVMPKSCELEVRLMLPSDDDDPTRQPLHFKGHVDQIRRDRSGQLRIWDVKSGRGSGEELLAEYAWQLAVYAAAATATLKQLVLPGGIIRLRAYDRGGPHAPGVFWEAPWTPEDVATMIATIAHEIGVIRSGKIPLRPGLHCAWCPASPFWSCHQRVPDLPTVGQIGNPLSVLK